MGGDVRMKNLTGMILSISGLLLAAVPGSLAETIKVGAIFAVTGPASFLGAPEAKTAEMLLEQINAKGGINGDKIELIIKDSQASPEKAVSFTKQLIEEEKVAAIIGPSTSGETMRIKAICEENKMVLVSCAAAEVIVNPVAKYVFKTPQKDSQAIAWIYKTMKTLGLSKSRGAQLQYRIRKCRQEATDRHCSGVRDNNCSERSL